MCNAEFVFEHLFREPYASKQSSECVVLTGCFEIALMKLRLVKLMAMMEVSVAVVEMVVAMAL